MVWRSSLVGREIKRFRLSPVGPSGDVALQAQGSDALRPVRDHLHAGLGDDLARRRIHHRLPENLAHQFVGFGRDLADDLPVRGLYKAQVVDPRVGRQTADQADVGTLRGLNGTDPAVVGVVDVPDLNAGFRSRHADRRAPGRRGPACGSVPPAGLV